VVTHVKRVSFPQDPPAHEHANPPAHLADSRPSCFPDCSSSCPPYIQSMRSPAHSPACTPTRLTREYSTPRDSAAVWVPSPDTCYRCLRSGHRARECFSRPFCPFHKREGHRWDDCRTFLDRVRQTKLALYRVTSNQQRSADSHFLDIRPAHHPDPPHQELV